MGAFSSSFIRELVFLLNSRFNRMLTIWFPLLVLFITWWIFVCSVPRELPIAMVDEDHSAVSRQYQRMLNASAGVEVAYLAANLEEAWSLARSGKVWAVVFVPPDTEKEIKRGNQAELFAFYNAQHTVASGLAMRDIGQATIALGAHLAVNETAFIKTPAAVHHAPIAAQTTTLFNPGGNYECLLVTIIHPAAIHLLLCLCVISAVGMEVQHNSLKTWVDGCGGNLFAALSGKITPYIIIFSIYGFLSLVFMTIFRGCPIRGSLTLIMIGYVLMLISYGWFSVALVGICKHMTIALPMVNIFAGAAIAFSGGLFPASGAPLAVRIWSVLLPFTIFYRLLMQQMHMSSPLHTSMIPILILAVFAIAPMWPSIVWMRSLYRNQTV